MAYQSNFKGDEVVALLNMVKNGGAGAVVRNLFTGDTLLDEEKAYNAETYQMVMEAEIPPIIMLYGVLPMYIDKNSTSTDTSIRIYYHVHIAGEHGVVLCKLGSDGTVTEETLAYDYCILYDNGDTANTGVFKALQTASFLGNIIIEDSELGILRPVQIIPVDEDLVILVATDYSSGPFVNLVGYLVASDDIVSRQAAQGPAAGGGEVLYLHKDEGAYTEQEQAVNEAVLEAIKQGTLGGAAVVNYDGEYYTVVTAYAMTISGEDEYFIVATDYGKAKLLLIGKTGVEEFPLLPQTVIYINEGQTEQQKKENFINLMGAVAVHQQDYPNVYFRDGDKYYTALGSIGLDWFFWDIQTASVGVVTINVDSDAGTLETTVERIPLSSVFSSLSPQVVVVPIGRELTDSEKQSNVEAYEAITNGMSLVFADCGAALCFAKAYLDVTATNFVIDVPTDSGVTTYKVVLAADGSVTTTELGSGSSAGTTDTTAVVEFVTSGELTAEQKATNAAVYSRIANGEKVVTFVKRDGEAYLMPMLHTDYDGHNVFFDLLQAFSSESGEAALGVSHIVMSSDGTVTASGSTYPLTGGSDSESELREIYVADALDESKKAYNAETYNKIREGVGVLPYIKGANGTPRYLCNFTLWGGSTPYITMKAYVFDTLQDGEYTYLLVKLMSDGTALSEDNEKTLPSLAVDSTLSNTSENPVQNKVVETKFNEVDGWLTTLTNRVKDVEDSLGIKEVSQATTYGTVAIKPNVLNKWSFPLTDILEITFASGTSGIANYYMLEFTTGNDIPTITLPNGVKWMGGNNILDNLEPNTTYQISVLNNLAVGGAF